MTTKKQNPEIVSVSYDEMKNVLMNVEKGTICNVLTRTVPRMNLGGRTHDNQFMDRVIKITSGSFTCGNNYGDRVRNELKKRGLNPDSYVPEPSKVGEHVSKCVTTNENTGNSHFQMEFHEEVRPTVRYEVDGVVLDLSKVEHKDIFNQFEKYIIKSSPSKKQLILGIEDSVCMFSPSIQNIREITLNKVRYVLQD